MTAEIAKALGVGRQRAYIISRQRNFPEPVATVEAGQIWRAEDVEAWIAKHRPEIAEEPESD